MGKEEALVTWHRVDFFIRRFGLCGWGRRGGGAPTLSTDPNWIACVVIATPITKPLPSKCVCRGDWRGFKRIPLSFEPHHRQNAWELLGAAVHWLNRHPTVIPLFTPHSEHYGFKQNLLRWNIKVNTNCYFAFILFDKYLCSSWSMKQKRTNEKNKKKTIRTEEVKGKLV